MLSPLIIPYRRQLQCGLVVVRRSAMTGGKFPCRLLPGKVPSDEYRQSRRKSHLDDGLPVLLGLAVFPKDPVVNLEVVICNIVVYCFYITSVLWLYSHADIAVVVLCQHNVRNGRYRQRK